jgi:hypothetical protein
MRQGRRNTEASRIANAFIDDLGIKDPLKRFHSWRHTIATLLTDDYGVPEVRAKKTYRNFHQPDSAMSLLVIAEAWDSVVVFIGWFRWKNAV